MYRYFKEMRQKCAENEKKLVKDFIDTECVVLLKEDLVFPEGNTVEKLKDLFELYMDWRVEVLDEVNDKRFYKDSIGVVTFNKMLTEKGYESVDVGRVKYKVGLVSRGIYEKYKFKQKKLLDQKVVEKKEEKVVNVDRNVPSIYMYNKYLEKGYLPKEKLDHFVEMYEYLKDLDDTRLGKSSMVYLGPIKQWKRLGIKYFKDLSRLAFLPKLDLFDNIVEKESVTRSEYEEFCECFEEYRRLEKEGYVDERWKMNGEDYLGKFKRLVK